MFANIKNITRIGWAKTEDGNLIPLYELYDIPCDEWNMLAAKYNAIHDETLDGWDASRKAVLA